MHHNSCYWAEQGAAINSHQQGFCSQYLSKSTVEVNKCTFQCAVESVKITSFPCWCFLSRTFHVLKLRGKSEAVMLSLSHTLTLFQTDTLFLTLKNIHTHTLFWHETKGWTFTLTHTQSYSTWGNTDTYIHSETHTPSHVREAHTDEKLSVSTEDISEGGIRSFSPLGD